MDLVSSTSIAERMGDVRYFRFLNTIYSLMTDAVLRNEADIHKYVGDEVIFTWPMRVGVRYGNCLDLFFDIMSVSLSTKRNFVKSSVLCRSTGPPCTVVG